HQREAGSRPSVRAVQAQGRPVRSRTDHLCDQALTTSADTPNNKVVNNQSKVKGTEDPVLIFLDIVDTPDSSPDNKVASSRSRVGGIEDPVITFPDKVDAPDSKISRSLMETQ
ncbi:hypothetical protein TNIN_20871, partial [Trichonephila inaurata madagascariensis]